MLPQKFSGLDISQADSFIETYSDVVKAFKKDFETDAITLAKFKLSLTGPARDWFGTQDFATWEACVTAFKQQYKSKPSIVTALASYSNVVYDHNDGPHQLFSKLKAAAGDAGISCIKMDFFRKLPPEFQKDIIQGKALNNETEMLDIVETSWEASKVFQATNSVQFQETANPVQTGRQNSVKLTNEFEKFLTDKLGEMSLHSAQMQHHSKRKDPTPYHKRRSHSRERSQSRERRSRNSYKQDNFSRSRSRSQPRSLDHDRSRSRHRSRSGHRYDRSRSSSKNRITCSACHKSGHEWNTCYRLKNYINKGKLADKLQDFQ